MGNCMNQASLSACRGSAHSGRTALGLLELAKRGKHRAIVNTAAASALGGMLLEPARREGIELVNVVRCVD